MLIEYIVN